MRVIFDLEGTLIDGPSRTVFDGVERLLSSLQDRGAILYLWTGAHSSVKGLLNELGLAKYFRDFCFCDMEYPKPDPRGPLSLLDFDPNDRLVVIGDTRYDYKGARGLRAQFIGAGWSGIDVEMALKDMGVDQVAAAPLEVLKFI